MADSFAQFAGKLQAFEKLTTGRPTLTAIGVGAKGDYAEAVHRDFGDDSMSNFRRGNPIRMVARFDLKGDSEVEVTLAGRAKGPGTVAERGRRAGVSRRGRPYGASRGKQTWSDAVALMERRTPGRVEIETAKAIARIFNRG